ncbi:basic helix-loop-helix (bHLH) DNA-binding superfamily protein [Raphanus sativus]|nr:basic helix-loop-helix (bHLH) DNA-binding superfamily protein [Raphanus sativus]
MTGEFEMAGTWWSSPINTATSVFSGYSLPRHTESSLDITDFEWQNFDNKTNDHNDDFMNMHNSFFEGLFDPNEQLLSDSWPKTTISTAKSELLESFPFLDNMFLINSEAHDHIKDHKSRIDTLSPLPSFKVRKEKLGDRITALQQLVSPFGKTDTASVLNEAVEYIKFLQEQVTVLVNPDHNTRQSVQRQQCSDKEEEECNSRRHEDLASRGLCLMPISASYPVAAAAASAAEMNTYDFSNLTFAMNS